VFFPEANTVTPQEHVPRKFVFKRKIKICQIPTWLPTRTRKLSS
jgi:hypothetical protein